MSTENRTQAPSKDPLDDALAAIPSCAATEAELQRQRERMRALGPSVRRFSRVDNRVTIEFSRDFDRGLMDETLAVERECCPFFRFDLDGKSRRLHVTVDDAERRVALDALVDALGAGQGG
jgi:hypothetical protein